MKRLTMLFCVAMTATTLAQGRALGGSWALDAEKSGRTDGPPIVTITLTAEAFTVRMGGPNAPLFSFKLDGSETDLGRGGKGKAQWKGDKLEATLTSPNGAQSLTFSREGAWLVQEGQTGRGPIKLYFKKAPAQP